MNSPSKDNFALLLGTLENAALNGKSEGDRCDRVLEILQSPEAKTLSDSECAFLTDRLVSWEALFPGWSNLRDDVRRALHRPTLGGGKTSSQELSGDSKHLVTAAKFDGLDEQDLLAQLGRLNIAMPPVDVN